MSNWHTNDYSGQLLVLTCNNTGNNFFISLYLLKEVHCTQNYCGGYSAPAFLPPRSLRYREYWQKNLCKDLLHEIIIKYNGGNKRGQFFHVLKALYLNFSALSSKHFRRVYNFITMTILNLKPLYRIRCSMNVVPAGALAWAPYLGTKSEQVVWYL